MDIRGIQKFSMIDFPGQLCSTVFVGGCNLRCPYCYNRELVLNPASLQPVAEAELLAFLDERTSFLDGLCISGGEPTLQENLVEFISSVKAMGLKIKLDTNGTKPDVIRELLREKLLDYIAVDIKAPPSRYPLLAGVDVDASAVLETIELLKGSSLEHEFRTTVVPGLLTTKDILNIAQMLTGCRRYVLQQFQLLTGVIDPTLGSAKPYCREKIFRIAQRCEKYTGSVQLRGF